MRLYSMIERIRPELITIGPIYQLHEEDPNEEGPARKLTAVLDKMRAISGAALITEAHSPHGDGIRPMIRPIGASLWKRWPEFGLCLLPVPQSRDASDADVQLSLQMQESALRPWRGGRAMGRQWPSNLCRGAHLPWEPYERAV